MCPQIYSPEKLKVSPSANPDFQGQLVHRLISKSYKFKLKATQSGQKSDTQLQPCQEQGIPILFCELIPGKPALGLANISQK